MDIRCRITKQCFRCPPRRCLCSSRQSNLRPQASLNNGTDDGNKKGSGNGAKRSEPMSWEDNAVPSYLQSHIENTELCDDWAMSLAAAEAKASRASGFNPIDYNGVWAAIRKEAQRDAEAEPLLSSFLYASILAHDCYERALAFVLSNRLANSTMLPTQLFDIFFDVLTNDPEVYKAALADNEAVRERDPACTSYSAALLYFKGFHAIQTHRIAHSLYNNGRKVMALALQSRASEVFAVDIHPGARLGRGVLMDHGTGVVIGETAVVGNNVSMLQGVTLGGTGKEVGDRHPKISDNVLIGACATILGNITIGKGAQIAAGSLVLKPVPPHTVVAGAPAKEIGKVEYNPALKMQQWSRRWQFDPVAMPSAPSAVDADVATRDAMQPSSATATMPAASQPVSTDGDSVDAVTTNEEAIKKWGNTAAPPEYLI